MNATIYNNKLQIVDPTSEVVAFAKNSLSFTDKSKQYQVKRMEKNPWLRHSRELEKLRKEVKGSIYKFKSNVLTFPQGFYHLFEETFPEVEIVDNRKETGHKIVVPWINRPHNLREYQEEAVGILLRPNTYRAIINFATGLGKTLTATHLIQRYKKNALIVCPSDSVARQFYDQLSKCLGNNKVGFYGGNKKQIKDITVGIAASVTRNVKAFQDEDLGLVIFDEIHHIAANTFFSIAEGLADVGKVFGLTATDYRSDGKDILITAGCGPVVIRRDIKWGVENKYLAEPYFIVREVDTKGKDFKDNKTLSYKEHVLNNQTMKDQIFNDANKMLQSGKSVLVLVNEVEHGKELSEQLGVPFATGEDPKSQDYVDQLNAGKIPGLVGTDGRIGEGTDTQNVDVLILANFVASKGSVIQAVGRGLRKTATKEKCLILDYIPKGSSMLSRHAHMRISYYREITDKVKVV